MKPSELGDEPPADPLNLTAGATDSTKLGLDKENEVAHSTQPQFDRTNPGVLPLTEGIPVSEDRKPLEDRPAPILAPRHRAAFSEGERDFERERAKITFASPAVAQNFTAEPEVVTETKTLDYETNVDKAVGYKTPGGRENRSRPVMGPASGNALG